MNSVLPLKNAGTVAASIADIDFVKRREGIEESFEDGTVSFLNIASVRHGFNILNTLTPLSISRYTTIIIMNQNFAVSYEFLFQKSICLTTIVSCTKMSGLT